MNFDAFLTADGLVALVTLTVLEVVLGIDNVIFISILAGKLPKEQQEQARRIGLMAAMGMRILLLMSIAWIVATDGAAVHGHGVDHPVSGRDLILIIGGLFLLSKATREIHDKLEGEEGHVNARVAPTLAAVDHADHAARHRLLARLGDHRRRHGRRPRRHGRRRRHRRRSS